MNHVQTLLLAITAVLGLGGISQAGDAVHVRPQSGAAEVGQILSMVPFSGGVAVHLGCGNGALLSALAESGPWVVHGVEDDPAMLDVARQRVVAADLWGRVTVDRWTGRLAYIDNLVNLLIVEHPDWVSRAEMLRVLAPGGLALLRTSDGWEKLPKPWPEDVDQWTHYLHGADGNAVANDRRVGPPRVMQWLADPLWCRYHHTLASVSSVVSADGRLFALVDDAPSASIEVPGRWWLVCRHAFNGVLLWKKPMENWAWWRQRFRSGPVQLPRLLVTDGPRVYAPLGISAEISIIDAASGQALGTCADTKGAEEIVLDQGRLFVVAGDPLSEQSLIDPLFAKQTHFPNEKRIVAVDARSGDALWCCPADRVGTLVPLSMAAAEGAVYYVTQEAIVCLGAADGVERWRSELSVASQGGPAGRFRPNRAAAQQAEFDRVPGWSVATLVVCEGVVLFADGRHLRALDAGSGKLLWQCASPPGFRSPNDVFVIDGLVWIGPLFTEGRHLRRGRVERTSGVLPDLWTAGHHHRCYREKATGRYILTNYRGIEFVDLVGDDHSRNNWVRGVCQYGVMPCNGLVYAPPHACGCYMEGKLFGFWALAADGTSLAVARNERPVQERLQRGPAYTAADSSNEDSSTDWPTYRHDPLRSGSTPVQLDAALETRWKADIGGQITAPVVAEGLALVASVDRHRLVALDARTGKLRWQFTAGGRIDSPPTVWRGRVLFGSADGHVYCLRAADGASVWRFLAAPGQLQTVVREQLESVWPAHGSVLVEGGTAYVAAGRYSYLDGGFWLYALDAATGRVLHGGRIEGQHPKGTEGTTHEPIKQFDQNSEDSKTRLAPDRSDAFSMFAGRSDVLVSDGHSIYLHHLRLDRQCNLQPAPGRHLFSTSQLLDGEENHRSHWVLGTGDFSRIPVAYSWIANSGGVRGATQMAVPYGLLLAFDSETVWAVRRGKNYRLLAHPNRPFSPDEEPLPDFRPLDRQRGKQPPTSWSVDVPLRPRAMVRAGGRLVLGGTPTEIDQADPYASFEGRKGGLLWIGSASDGAQQSLLRLDSPPVWDGLAVAADGLFASCADGSLVCLAPATSGGAH